MATASGQRPDRGADALAAAMARAGIGRVFSLSGNHIMALYDAMPDAGIELVHVRHEGAAVHMADAWSRLTGGTGVALLTGGPGHANGVSALYTALAAESPMVLLSGQAPLAEAGRGAFQEIDQVALAAPLVKASLCASSPQEVGAAFARAVTIAHQGRPGPVYLSLPSDVLEGSVADREAALATVPAASAGTALPATSAEAILARLRQARRPLVLAGPACMTSAARPALAALSRAAGVPVLGMESPRGVNDPSLGAFAEVLAEADCVLLVGKPVDFTLRMGAALPARAGVMVVDPDPAMIARAQRALGAERVELCAVAAAVPALRALAEAAGRAGEPIAPEWAASVAEAVAWRPPSWTTVEAASPGRLHPVQMCRAIQPLLDADPSAVLVVDGGEIGQWAQSCLRAPDRIINGVAGSIGSALPFALAASLARPGSTVVAVLGDGTFGFHPAEFDTAVRAGARFVAVVGNDQCWNAEHQIQLRDYGPARAHGCELLPTRYDRVAEGFGGHGEFVTAAGELPAALARAQASGRPACVNVLIERHAAPVLRRG